MEKKWKITIELYRTYEISAETEDEAVDIAYESFEEDDPDIFVEKMDNEEKE